MTDDDDDYGDDDPCDDDPGDDDHDDEEQGDDDHGDDGHEYDHKNDSDDQWWKESTHDGNDWHFDHHHSTTHDTGKIVSDLVIGPNLRWKDNLYQGLFIMVMVGIGAIVGCIVTTVQANPNVPWFAGAIVGAIGGLLVGLFTSGIFLMIYRAVRHGKGKHD